MPTLDQVAIKPKDGGESVILFGPPKSGKTELAATLAADFKLHWFDCENGIQSVLKSPRIKKEWHKNITYYRIPDTRTNPIAIKTMMKVYAGNECKICEEHGDVGCLLCGRTGAPSQTIQISKLGKDSIVVCDSLTQLNDSAYFQVVGGDVDTDKDWKHYDRWNQRIAMCLSFIQQSKCHHLMIGHAKLYEQADETVKLCPVGGTSKFSPNVPKYFGHSLYADFQASQFKVFSKQADRPNVIIGSRSDLKFDGTNVKLKDFFL